MSSTGITRGLAPNVDSNLRVWLRATVRHAREWIAEIIVFLGAVDFVRNLFAMVEKKKMTHTHDALLVTQSDL